MKTQLQTIIFLFIFCVAASAQQAGVIINPATGLPDDGSGLPKIDPATGLQRSDLYDEWQKAKTLMNQGQYEDSLDALTNYFEQSRFDRDQQGSRLFSLGDWYELGRRYPKAKAALLELRDADAQKLLSDDGDFIYFAEVNVINQRLGKDEATYTLFKAIEKSNPHLAGQCFGLVVDQLIQKGEYKTCRKYMGDPETDFQNNCDEYHIEMENQARTAEFRQQAEQIRQEFYRQHPNSHPFPLPDTSKRTEKMFKDRFVNKVRQLVEILVATGGEADAQKIQKESLAILADPRLESAVDDAKAKVAQAPL